VQLSTVAQLLLVIQRQDDKRDFKNAVHGSYHICAEQTLTAAPVYGAGDGLPPMYTVVVYLLTHVLLLLIYRSSTPQMTMWLTPSLQPSASCRYTCSDNTGQLA
jgi:hypothetical protein